MAKGKKSNQERTGLSRRDFFRGSTAGAFSAGLFPRGLLGTGSAATELEVQGPGKVDFTLTINGRPHRVELEPRVTLLDALRNTLDITSAKRVCDRGTCGACTVLIDGKPIYACSILAIDAQEAAIETVESLGTPDRLHPIQQAFVNHDAQQCGFCTPGFVVSCKALLERHPNPGPEEVARGLGGNLCRCGTYAGIQEVVREIAQKGGSHA